MAYFIHSLVSGLLKAKGKWALIFCILRQSSSNSLGVSERLMQTQRVTSDTVY